MGRLASLMGPAWHVCYRAVERRYLLMWRGSFVLSLVACVGCATAYTPPPLTTQHPAHPEATAAPELPPSTTLAYTPSDIPSLRPALSTAQRGTRGASPSAQPSAPTVVQGLETQALRQSLDLASARQRLIAGGEQVGLSRATALVPESSLGAGAEREEGEWKVGPVLEFPIPLFDQGQARIGRAVTELRRVQQEYYALGVRLRSTAGAVRERLQGAQDRALYYRDILLPLRERIVNETLLQYNAMQIGVIELLRAREQQIQAAVAYVDTLLDYWLARTDLEQLLSGRLPSPNGGATGRIERPTAVGENAGH